MVYYGDGYAKNLGNWENWELSSVSKPIKTVSNYVLITQPGNDLGLLQLRNIAACIVLVKNVLAYL